MEAFGLRRVDLAVLYAAAGAHDLDLAGLELRVIAHAILVLDGAFEDVRKDLHVLMAMGREAHTRSHQILSDDAEGPEGHVGRVIVIREAEAMSGDQPAVVSKTAVSGTSYREVHPR